MVTVTWTMGTMTVSITGDSVNEAKLTRDVFFPSTAAAPRSRRLVDLVGELEGLIERLWGRDYMKAATFREATQVYAILPDVYIDCIDSEIRNHDANLVALEADGAGNARRRIIALDGTLDIDKTASDGHTAESRPEVLSQLKAAQAILLRCMFASEFFKLALSIFEVGSADGEIVVECRDLLATKKRAEALKCLAARIDELEGGYDGCKIHDAIIAYMASRNER